MFSPSQGGKACDVTHLAYLCYFTAALQENIITSCEGRHLSCDPSVSYGHDGLSMVVSHREIPVAAATNAL